MKAPVLTHKLVFLNPDLYEVVLLSCASSDFQCENCETAPLEIRQIYWQLLWWQSSLFQIYLTTPPTLRQKPQRAEDRMLISIVPLC